jgi:hypothetical protein
MTTATITATCESIAPHSGRACTLDAGHEGRHESGMIVWDAGQAPATLAALLAAVLAAGCAVSFSYEPLDGYVANVDMFGDADTVQVHTAIAASPAGALEAAAFAAGLIPDPGLRLIFSDEDLAGRVAALERRADEDMRLLITTLRDTVTMLMDSGVWAPGQDET